MDSGTTPRAQLSAIDRTPLEFSTFYRTYAGRVLATVMALRGPNAAAEDVAQDAFLRAFERWGDLTEMRRPDLWVQRVALNLATSRLRRLATESRAVMRLQQRAGRDIDPAGRPPSLTDAPFWEAVRRLPSRQARVVALRYAADLSIQEIADTVGVAPSTVASQLATARQRLGQLLAPSRQEHS